MAKRPTLLVLAAVTALLTGCGGSSSEGDPTAAADSSSCIGCHTTAVSHVTGGSIVEEWRQSVHSSPKGAGCRDCHEPHPSHPSSCGVCHGGTTPAGEDVVRNPDSSGKCLKCHGTATTVFRGYSGTGYSTAAKFHAHFTNLTSGRYPASYVSVKNTGACRRCHAPHNPTGHLTRNKDWAASAHGNVSGPAWTSSDFRTRGTTGAGPAVSAAEDCVRCHTMTGFIRYVSSGFTDVSPVASKASSKVRGKEVIGCPACHDDGRGNSYSFRRRSVPPVRAWYNYSSTGTGKILGSVTMPDEGTSNLCVPCHAGRTRGAIITAADAAGADFTKLSFINSHYRAAAGVLHRTTGYHFSGRDYTDSTRFEHARTGVVNFRDTGTSGPCITCHMKPARHSFSPLTHAGDGSVSRVVSTGCAQCHQGLDAAAMEEYRQNFLSALEALKYFLAATGYYSRPGSASFYTKPYVALYREEGSCSENLTVQNWQTGGTWTYEYDSSRRSCTPTSLASAGSPGTGPNNLGAAFNYNMLLREPGAYTHNSVYARRLLYDSIDWLDDNILNHSTGRTLSTLSTDFRDGAIRYLIRKDTACTFINLTGTDIPEQRP